MAHIIKEVEQGSIADQLGIVAGDALASINGERIVDWVDYQALSCAEQISLQITRGDQTLELVFEKDDYEPLGLSFEGDMMGGIRSCCNDCIFCFVDQLPGGTRESMHVKDDDWRTSLMMGSFVTLTNVSDRELSRIVVRNASPLYISVHATDDELRSHMLGTKRGAGIMQRLKALKDGGISYHLQCVMCPGINDGDALDETIEALASLHPAALSLALVPVGLTGHREGLSPLGRYDWHSANDLLDQVKRWRKQLYRHIGTRFVFPADEFYVLGGRKFPSDEAYEGYPQIDNGVGLCRSLEAEFSYAYEDVDLSLARPSKNVVACGVSVAPFLRDLFDAHPIPGVEVTVVPVENAFFGPSVTVSGLVTGSDLIRTLSGTTAERILITECMLRDGGDLFLDDLSRDEVAARIGTPIVPVGRTGEALLEALMGVAIAY